MWSIWEVNTRFRLIPSDKERKKKKKNERNNSFPVFMYVCIYLSSDLNVKFIEIFQEYAW